MNCEHKCHKAPGLNPWVEECPVCGCPNKSYDPKAEDTRRPIGIDEGHVMAKAKWKQIIDVNISLMSNRDLLDAVYEAATTCGADEQEASSRDFYYYERATDVLEHRLREIGFLPKE